MDPNLVSATLSTEDQQAILSAVNGIVQKLPFLIDLTTNDRVAMAKLGDKTEAFVRKAVEIAVQHQTLFSTGFLEEMKKDADLLDVISAHPPRHRYAAEKDRRYRHTGRGRSFRRGTHRLPGDQDTVRERRHAHSLR